MAIGFLVVDEERSCLWPWGVGDDPQVLVEPDGILGKVEQHVVPADVVGLEPSVVRGERMNRAFDVFERNVAAVGGCASRQKVVGHVRARERRFRYIGSVRANPHRGQRYDPSCPYWCQA